jgi:hypothetical protein
VSILAFLNIENVFFMRYFFLQSVCCEKVRTVMFINVDYEKYAYPYIHEKTHTV